MNHSMRYYRVLASAAALAAVISFAGVADAGGSSGGLIGGGSSGASSGGAFGARLASLKSRLHSGGSSGGASHGSSGGGALRARLSSCLLYTSPSPRDKRQSRMPSSA